MATSYDAAVSTLYQAPLAGFVEERKRLSAELKADGDPAGAARLSKLGRPPISAWAVNQLWWRERDVFEALFESAQRLREGDLSAGSEHRQALLSLRKHAAELLTEGGHGAADATLRRVTATLSALAAAGGFEPDAPGALGADREAPGFEGAEAWVAPAKKEEPKNQRARAREEQKREQQERKERLAQRRRVESELKAARKELEDHERETKRLGLELKKAEASAAKALARVQELEAGLDQLGDGS